MGRGILKAKKKFKLQYVNECHKEITRLTDENKKLKEDPNGVIAPFLERFNTVVVQNNRLSALAAALIDQLDGKATVTKATIESFNGFRLLIKIETPDGAKDFDSATEYYFTYEKAKADQPKDIAPAAPECTDPDCTLPKDLKHSHTPEPVPDPPRLKAASSVAEAVSIMSQEKEQAEAEEATLEA